MRSVFERAGFEIKDPVYNDGRVIVEEEHLGLKAELICSTTKYLAPYRLEEVELQHVEHGSFLVDIPEHNQGTGELSKETRQSSFQEVPELGRIAKSGSEKVATKEPVRTNLGKVAARVLRERNERTFVLQAPDGEPFHQH